MIYPVRLKSLFTFLTLLILTGTSYSLASSEGSTSESAHVFEGRTDHKKVVFTFDGGGARGYIQAVAAGELERRVRTLTDIDDLRLAECLDFVAGTSTGSITSSYLTCPDSDDPSRPRYSASSLVDYFDAHIHEVFQRSFLKRLKSLFGLSGPKFSSYGFEGLLNDLFGDTPLKQAVVPTAITTLELSDKDRGTRPLILTSFDANPADMPNSYADNFSEVSFKDACRSSGAAPTYFKPHRVPDNDGEIHHCVDGGVMGANNPVEVGFDYASILSRNKEEHLHDSDFSIVSFGTGKAPLYISGESAEGFGLAQWGLKMLPILLDAPSMLMEEKMAAQFPVDNPELEGCYFRFQPVLEEPIDLADTSPAALETLRKVAHDYIEANEDKFDHVACILAARYTAKQSEGTASSIHSEDDDDDL